LAVVRRETGGRAVLHHEELTYCVCIPVDSPFHSSSLPEAYNRINSALAAGLRHLGVEPSQESRKVDLAAAYRRETGGLCFAATAQSEVLWDGRKLVGSAQRQLREGLLQHGSLITGPAHLEISRIFFTDERLREAATAKLRRETTSLEEALGSRPSFKDIALALRKGVEESFGLSLEADELHAEEVRQVGAWLDAFKPEHGAVRLTSPSDGD
jgi:lipoate-protein ligase A